MSDYTTRLIHVTNPVINSPRFSSLLVTALRIWIIDDAGGKYCSDVSLFEVVASSSARYCDVTRSYRLSRIITSWYQSFYFARYNSIFESSILTSRYYLIKIFISHLTKLSQRYLSLRLSGRIRLSTPACRSLPKIVAVRERLRRRVSRPVDLGHAAESRKFRKRRSWLANRFRDIYLAASSC